MTPSYNHPKRGKNKNPTDFFTDIDIPNVFSSWYGLINAPPAPTIKINKIFTNRRHKPKQEYWLIPWCIGICCDPVYDVWQRSWCSSMIRHSVTVAWWRRVTFWTNAPRANDSFDPWRAITLHDKNSTHALYHRLPSQMGNENQTICNKINKRSVGGKNAVRWENILFQVRMKDAAARSQVRRSEISL